MGYADDLATCSTSKYNLDKAINVVATHGRTWRYDFNAKISGILVYGEDKAENIRNVSLRSFRLGSDKVSERTHYDHVGIRASIFEDDVSGLEERVSKARRTLNAISGLGVRRCGLTIKTCNIIFWSVVVPIATYGCELLFLTDGHTAILEEFQEYAGRKLQRFHSRSPRACAYFTLGWIRLERYVEVKKLLFLYSVFLLDDDCPVKIVFMERALFFFEHYEQCSDNQFRSPTFDLLCTAHKFGILDRVENMVISGLIVSKKCWSMLIWNRAWDLERIHWAIQIRSHESLMIIEHVCHTPRYLVWWELSDIFPDKMGICEIMAKLVCRCSMLKSDDLRLKNLTASNRWCELCEMSEVEDVRHLILNCSGTQETRDLMFERINEIANGNMNYEQIPFVDRLQVLLGATIDGLSLHQMVDIWLTSAFHIGYMYMQRIKSRKGIG